MSRPRNTRLLATDPDAAARRVLRRAAKSSADGATVALVFATAEFVELLLNWACFALGAGVRWFVLVAMDASLFATLSASPARRHAVLLPRVAGGNVTIDKLSVIGERQRFGAAVLASGLNVVHSDADALWLRDPSPLLAGSDIVAERIWGKPLSVVKDWGAAVCTGFYYLRAGAGTLSVANAVAAQVAAKHARHPGWQTSDQLYLNLVLHRLGVRWACAARGASSAGCKMGAFDSMHTRFYDTNGTVGTVGAVGTVGGTRVSAADGAHGPLRILMLAHAHAARACPVLNVAERARLASGGRLGGKPALWRLLLQRAFVLHCFPPGGEAKPGEKRTVFMGHPKHTAAELAFQRQQGLWRLRADWREAAGRAPEAMCASNRGIYAPRTAPKLAFLQPIFHAGTRVARRAHRRAVLEPRARAGRQRAAA